MRRLGGPEGALGGLPGEDRPADPAGLGDDRDVPGRLRRPDQVHAARPLRGGAGRRARRAGPRDPAGRVRIVEPGTDDELPWDGEARGELQVAGPWIAAGYYNDERSKAPFTEDGWLRTGDVATISPEGYVRLVDRTKDLVKSGGEWISSVELENAIMAHPKVAEAAVIGDPRREVGRAPAGLRRARGRRGDHADELREFLADRVPKWWIPNARDHRRGPEDLGREVLQEDAARALPRHLMTECELLDLVGRAAGWSSQVARRAHNPKVAGSIPPPLSADDRRRRPPPTAGGPAPQLLFVVINAHELPCCNPHAGATPSSTAAAHVAWPSDPAGAGPRQDSNAHSSAFLEDARDL